MSGWLKVVLGLVVVGALAGAYVLLESGGSADGESGPGGLGALSGSEDGGPTMDDLASVAGERRGDAQPLQAQAEELPAGTVDAAAALVEEESEPRPRTRVVGRLVDANARPVADARVVAHVSSSADLALRFAAVESSAPTRPETRSGPDGRFALEFALPEEDEETEERDGFLRAMLGEGARLAVVHEAFAVHVEEGVELAEGDVDVGTLTLAPGAGVSGRVVDGRGGPVEGATVVARAVQESGGGPGFVFTMFNGSVRDDYTRVQTGRDGRFRIPGLPVGPAEVSAEAEGKQMAWADDFELAQGESRDLGDLVLEDGGAIAGYVTDENGRPVEGASVRVSSMSRIVLSRAEDMPRRSLGREMRMRAETDADGWFELAGLGKGQYTVHVNADGYARSSTDNVSTGTFDFSARLEGLGALEVLLVSARDGQPVEDAEVSARNAERWGPGEELEVEPGDGPGRWRVPGAGAEGTELTVSAEGFATVVHDAPGVVSGETHEVRLELVQESVLAGRVLDADGNGVAGARVRVTEWLPPADPMTGGAVTIERNIRRGAGLDQAASWQRARTDESGDFLLRGVPAGDWEVVADAEGYVRAAPVTVSLEVGGEQRDLELRLASAGVLTGLVVDDQGQPVRGASVRITPQGQPAASDDPAQRLLGFSMPGAEGDPSAPRNETTDDEGRFRVDDLPEGRVLAQLTKGGNGMGFGGAMVFFAGMGGGDTLDHPDAQAQATIVAGEEAFVRLVRPPMSAVEGRVLADGVGVPDVTVNLKEAGSFLPFGGQTVKTDALGNFGFEAVQPGEYTLSSQIPGAGLEESVDVELTAGRSERADLVFEGQSIRGRVVDVVTGAGVGGLTLEVKAQTQAPTTQTSATVAFSFVSAGSGGGGSSMTVDMGGEGSRLVTDADGSFEAKWLDPGDYKVVVSGGGYMETESELLTLEPEVDVDGVVIEVGRGAVLHGIVSDGSTGKPLEGVPVSLRGADIDGMDMRVTEADGAYRFEGLSPGQYDVAVMGSGFGAGSSATDSVELGPGEDRALDLRTSNDA